MVNAAIERHTTMLCQNYTDGCLSCQNGTAKNSQTRWRRKETGASLPDRSTQPTSEPTSPLPSTPTRPGTPPVPPGYNAGAQHSQLVQFPARSMNSHTSVHSAEFFTLDAYAQDSQHDTDFDPDMLAEEGTSTG